MWSIRIKLESIYVEKLHTFMFCLNISITVFSYADKMTLKMHNKAKSKPLPQLLSCEYF